MKKGEGEERIRERIERGEKGPEERLGGEGCELDQETEKYRYRERDGRQGRRLLFGMDLEKRIRREECELGRETKCTTETEKERDTS